jgi:hypothetical protein
MTTFDVPEAEHALARDSFMAKKDVAWKKVDEIKKDLGTRWEELTGQEGLSRSASTAGHEGRTDRLSHRHHL